MWAERGPIQARQLQKVVIYWHKEASKIVTDILLEEVVLLSQGRGKAREVSAGSDPVGDALAKAKAGPPPKCADSYSHAKMKLLIGLCCELQRLHGERPFFLSCRKIEQCLTLHYKAQYMVADSSARWRAQGGWKAEGMEGVAVSFCRRSVRLDFASSKSAGWQRLRDVSKKSTMDVPISDIKIGTRHQKETTMAELKEIPLALIDDHPDNPRLVYRDDVIDSIVANLGEQYPQKHAVHVRPVGTRFQLTAGHHRKRAAEKKGLATIWAWVEEQDDAAAFMELATSNSQGELSPLEIGLHALKAVPLAQGGRGKKGGLAEYATRLAKDRGDLTRYRQAAEVFVAIRETIGSTQQFLDKAQHLAAIHKAERELWQVLAEYVLGKDWLGSRHRALGRQVRRRLGRAAEENKAWSKNLFS